MALSMAFTYARDQPMCYAMEIQSQSALKMILYSSTSLRRSRFIALRPPSFQPMNNYEFFKVGRGLRDIL